VNQPEIALDLPDLLIRQSVHRVNALTIQRVPYDSDKDSSPVAFVILSIYVYQLQDMINDKLGWVVSRGYLVFDNGSLNTEIDKTEGYDEGIKDRKEKQHVDNEQMIW
jgi:hypothetical protein